MQRKKEHFLTTTDDVQPPLILVTGVSGAGKTSALKALEDLGFEAVDNLPLTLLTGLVPVGEDAGGLAIGVDVRTRDFSSQKVLAALNDIRGHSQTDVRVLFMDCDDAILERRFTETRRRHPLALDRPVADGLRQERDLLAPLRAKADVVLDTSDMTLAQMQTQLETHFGSDAAPGLSIFVLSFSYRVGVPRDADLVFDARFLKNPHYDPALKPLTGVQDAVGAYVASDPDYEDFFKNLTGLIGPLLPRFAKEGKSYLTIAIGCTGGRHRSVFVAEQLAEWMRGQHIGALVRHRDMGKFGGPLPLGE